MLTCYQCKNKFCCDALDYNPITGVRTTPCDDFEPIEDYEQKGQEGVDA